MILTGKAKEDFLTNMSILTEIKDKKYLEEYLNEKEFTFFKLNIFSFCFRTIRKKQNDGFLHQPKYPSWL